MDKYRFIPIAITLLCCCGCLTKEEHPDPSMQFGFNKKPLTPDQSSELMSETGKNWLYGQGFGETALNIGGIVIFPPFALYVLTNAGLSVAGYETIKVSNALPDPADTVWSNGFEAIASVPGRGAALIADEPYRDEARARMSIEKILKESESTSNKQAANTLQVPNKKQIAR